MSTSRPLTMPTLPSGLSFVIPRCLSDCGLTASQAISLLYPQVILERGTPFQTKSFNEQTRRVPPLRGWGFRSRSPPWR